MVKPQALGDTLTQIIQTSYSMRNFNYSAKAVYDAIKSTSLDDKQPEYIERL